MAHGAGSTPTVDATLDAFTDFTVTFDPRTAPPEAMRRAHDILIDTIGCVYGGREAPGATVGLAFPALPADGAAGVVLTRTEQLPIDVAAFVNSSMLRFLDYNDTLRVSHPSDMLGALLAVTHVTRPTLEDLLGAIVVAYEVFHRLSERMLHMTPEDGFVVEPYTLDQGYAVAVGGAAGLARLMGLDAERTRHALSFAATNGTPLRATRSGQLSNYKGVATAVSARHAVFCAHMAAQGLTAPEGPFEGRHGIVELLTGTAGPFGLEPLPGAPGAADGRAAWGILHTQLKYFPCTANTQIGVWAALELRGLVDAADVTRITLHTCEFLHHESGVEAAKWRPTTRETADHSLPYVVAHALRHGGVGVGSYTPEHLNDPETLRVMDTIEVVVDDDIEAAWPGVLQVRAVAETRDGTTHTVHVQDPKGTSANFFTAEDLRTKFVALATPVIGAEAAEAAHRAVADAASDTPVADIVAALTPQG